MSRVLIAAAMSFCLAAGYVLGGCHHPKAPGKPCADPFLFDEAVIDAPFEGLDATFLRHDYRFDVHRVAAPGCETKWLRDTEPEPYRAWVVTLTDKAGRKLTYSLKQTKPAPTEPKTDRPVTDWRP